VVDEELRASPEEVGQRAASLVGLESIRLVDSNPRQLLPPPRQLVAAARELLLLFEDRKIYQIDPGTGAILRTIESNRFVTGVTWVDGELWHGTWEGDESELRRVDPRTGEVLATLEMPPGLVVSGLESDGGDLFFCGGGKSGTVRSVRRPTRGATRGPKR
jgi:outer membrane protein assembly factor BamB